MTQALAPALSGTVLAASFVVALAPLLVGLAQLRRATSALDGLLAYSLTAPAVALLAAFIARALTTMLTGHEVKIGLLCAFGLGVLFLLVIWTPAFIGIFRTGAISISVIVPGLIGSLLYQMPALLIFVLGASLLFGAKETAST